MGLLNALIESASRFRNGSNELLPVGYAERYVTWVVNIDPEGRYPPQVTKLDRKDGSKRIPATPADRTSSKVSATLLVDKPSYALGLPNMELKNNAAEQAKKEHEAFVKLAKEIASKSKGKIPQPILDLISNSDALVLLTFPGTPKKSELVAFEVGKDPWPTEDPEIQKLWSDYIEKRLAEEYQQCVLCPVDSDRRPELKPITRIQPFSVTLMKGTDSVQISSFNLDAFQSLGKTTIEIDEEHGGKRKKAGANAAICYSCASTAGQVLQHLVTLEKDNNGKDKSSGRHAVVLARDDSKGKGKQPLRNQIAVFWTREQMELQVKGGEKRQFEELAKAPIEELDEALGDVPPAKTGQCRALLEAPFVGGKDTAELPTNRFYLAVLSPNKSRLVVREWLGEKTDKTRDNIKRYMEALQVVHPDGRGVWWPPLPALLEGLRSYTSVKQKRKEGPRVPGLGPDVTRKLIQCIYTGTPPPEAILTRAVRCFRVPNPPTDDTPQGREQRERQMLRLMAMTAAMKLILTYNKNGKEQKAMEKLKTEHDAASEYKQQSPYNCGVLLAILEAIQRRASSSGRGVNTTVVDRFYGAASTAPATVFANLINMATKAHLPKLRREGKEFFKVRYQEEVVNINDLMTEACDAINAAGGFPSPLTPQKQAEFALGFYHQRAELNPPKRQLKSSRTDKNKATGGQL